MHAHRPACTQFIFLKEFVLGKVLKTIEFSGYSENMQNGQLILNPIIF